MKANKKLSEPMKRALGFWGGLQELIAHYGIPQGPTITALFNRGLIEDDDDSDLYALTPAGRQALLEAEGADAE